jgi:hypothetical protein
VDIKAAGSMPAALLFRFSRLSALSAYLSNVLALTTPSILLSFSGVAGGSLFILIVLALWYTVFG